MKSAYDIIIRPVISERSAMSASEGRYTFVVDPRATKLQIRQAAEQLFSVKVLKVNTLSVKGKNKRVRAQMGKTSQWKKAIVKIDLDPQADQYMAKGGSKSTTKKKYKTVIEDFGFGQ